MNHRTVKLFIDTWRSSGKVLRQLPSQNLLEKKGTLKVENRVTVRLRCLLSSLWRATAISDMESLSGFAPPSCVKGMTVLDRQAFVRSVLIPGVKVPKKDMRVHQKLWKQLQLKIRGLKPVGELSDSDPDRTTHSLVFLDPVKVAEGSLSEEQLETLASFGFDVTNPSTFTVELGYDNWSMTDVMKAVLPSDAENVTSFTQVGHIAHLNLKSESLPYKAFIGEVILDKLPSVKTVVNKVGAIDNTYRNFHMELLAGEDNYITQTKEHNCIFELDFSKVYWNSRLGTEHQRQVEQADQNSTVYDVFAGIGPFAVPLAKKKHCTVLANDLNPASVQYLKRNIELNKIRTGSVITYNLDGREFIKTIVKEDLTRRIKAAAGPDLTPVSNLETGQCGQTDSGTVKCQAGQGQADHGAGHGRMTSGGPETSDGAVPTSYVIMNLPALALDFLDSFPSLLQDLPTHLRAPETLDPFLPHIFCYTFTPKPFVAGELEDRVLAALGRPVPGGFSTRVVRNVAPNKEMVCVSFKVWPDLVLQSHTNHADKQTSLDNHDDNQADNQALHIKHLDSRTPSSYSRAGEPSNKRQKLTT